MPLGEQISLESRRQKKNKVLLKTRHFTAIGSSSVKTVASRYRLAAYYNKGY